MLVSFFVMRLFISIDIPENLHRYCKQLQSRFLDIKKTNQFHITLQFLGDDIESANPIIEVLKKIKFSPFEIEMGDVMPFGNPDIPKGVWIECKKNNSLQKLSDDIRKALKPLGFVSDFPLRPHITLGRYKSAPNIKPEIIKGEPHKFTVDKFYLMKSELTPNGPVHQIIEKF